MILRKYQEKDKLPVNLYRNGGIMKYGAGDVMGPPRKPTSNEPTLQDYLKVYSSSVDLENNLKKYPNYKLVNDNKLGDNDSWKERLFEARFSYDDWHNPKSKYIKKYLSNPKLPELQKKQILENMKNYNPEFYYKQDTPHNFYQRELSVGVLNKNFPMAYYDTRIRPTSQQRYEGTLKDNNGKIIDGVELFKYSPKAVKEEALKKFPGSEKEFEKIDISYAPVNSVPVPTSTQPTVVKTNKSKYPQGYQPYSLYGKILDPEIYGYGESISNRPIDVPQFADSYQYKKKMEEYKKTGKYPWAKN